MRSPAIDLDLESLWHPTSVAQRPPSATLDTTMGDSLYLLTVIAIGTVLVWFAFRLEPHWVSKDGRRFICKGQLMDRHGNTHGGWHEYRVRVAETDPHDSDRPEVHAARRGIMGRRQRGVWRVTARSQDPPRRKAVFLLHPATGAEFMLALRMPARSRAADTLDSLIG